jgi:Transcriptional regulator, AbiEi antitoxin, Type IV TA system
MMKVSGKYVKSAVVDALNRCLESVPFVKDLRILSEPDLGNMRPDILLDLSLPDGEQRVIVECKTVGQPRVARAAVNQLLRYLKDFPDAYGVFAAPYISPKAAEICAGEGIGYLDLAGNCRLSFGQVFIEKTGNPNPYSDKRDLRSLYSPKATRILRVLLSKPGTIWRLQTLAQEADVSLGLVSKVKKLLADREWITTESTGLRIADPEALLREWSDNYTFTKNEVRQYYSLKSVPEIEARIAEMLSRKSIRFALTGFSGADRLAPYTRYHKVAAYVDETDEDLAALLNLKKVTSGANVALLAPYDEGVFYDGRRSEGVKVVSPVQLYLDLCALHGRGEEAAKALLEKVIRPSW